MRNVEQEYKRLNESVMPPEDLIANTRALMQAELSADKLEARRKKRLMKQIGSYVAVAAAGALICAGVMTALPRAKSDSAVQLEGIMEEAVAEDVETNATLPEYADVTIYYVENGELKDEVAEDAECSVDAVFAIWAEKNGLEDVEILLVDMQSGSASLGVHLDVSGNFRNYPDEDGMIAASLSLTIGEYLNADGVVLTVEGQPV